MYRDHNGLNPCCLSTSPKRRPKTQAAVRFEAGVALRPRERHDAIMLPVFEQPFLALIEQDNEFLQGSVLGYIEWYPTTALYYPLERSYDRER